MLSVLLKESWSWGFNFAEDIVICEIGGTVGDIEGLPFFEAIRQFAQERPRGQCIFMHLTLLPYLAASGELKTKPTQHSVKELRSIGIQPDILVCRCDRPLPAVMKQKLSEFCDVDPECVVTSQDASSIYEVPLMLEVEGLAHQVLKLLNLENRLPDLTPWQTLVDRLKRPTRKVTIALVGKYIQLNDAYLSVLESLRHAATAQEAELELRWVNAEDIETHGAESYLKDVAGVVVPGGFGIRGVGGKIAAIR
ncbi:CTP synthase, partial [bacterium]|nr:CTP synthase [bacterium]